MRHKHLFLSLLVVTGGSGCFSTRVMNSHDGLENLATPAAASPQGSSITVGLHAPRDLGCVLIKDEGLSCDSTETGGSTEDELERAATHPNALAGQLYEGFGTALAERLELHLAEHYEQPQVVLGGTGDVEVEASFRLAAEFFSWNPMHTYLTLTPMSGDTREIEGHGQDQTKKANLAWGIPVAIVGYPVSTIIVSMVNQSLVNGAYEESMGRAMDDAAAQFADQLAGARPVARRSPPVKSPVSPIVAVDETHSLDVAETTLRNEASDAWASLSPLLGAGGPVAERTVQAFIVRYDGAVVRGGGQERRVRIPELTLARGWMEGTAPVTIPTTPVELEPAVAPELQQETPRELQPNPEPIVAAWSPAPSVVAPVEEPAPLASPPEPVPPPEPVSPPPEPVSSPPGPVPPPEPVATGATLPTEALVIERRGGIWASAITVDLLAAAAYGGAHLMRRGFDRQPSEALFYGTNGAFYGSIGLGASGLVLTSVALFGGKR